jgi:hypothetical protein
MTNKQPSLIDRCIEKIPRFLFVVKRNLFIKVNETSLFVYMHWMNYILGQR